MTVVKGKCDGKIVRLEHAVPVTSEVDVLVSFPEDAQREAPKGDLVQFLLNAPKFSEEEIASIEAGIEEFRRWRT